MSALEAAIIDLHNRIEFHTFRWRDMYEKYLDCRARAAIEVDRTIKSALVFTMQSIKNEMKVLSDMLSTDRDTLLQIEIMQIENQF